MPKGDGERAWFNRVIQGEWESIELQTLVSCETQRSHGTDNSGDDIRQRRGRVR